MKTISFFVGLSEEDALFSRYGDEVRYSSIVYKPYDDEEGSFNAYDCVVANEARPIDKYLYYLQDGKGRWTKKVPVEWKNAHREVWGLPPLKEEKSVPEWYIDEGSIWVPTPENVGDLPTALNEWAVSHGAKRKHWLGHMDCFKTWVFAAPLSVVVSEVAPLLLDTKLTVKLKSW